MLWPHHQGKALMLTLDSIWKAISKHTGGIPKLYQFLS